MFGKIHLEIRKIIFGPTLEYNKKKRYRDSVLSKSELIVSLIRLAIGSFMDRVSKVALLESYK